ncbi:MAG TPA: cache domain-containing protein [Terriglobia bacterium]|nr:cache domain-containing protein [Terriglobia bacterium]
MSRTSINAGAVFVIALAAGMGFILGADKRGTLSEAQAMLQKAGEHYTTVGRKQALADFTGKKAPFTDRDLYVVCVGPGGIVTAHGASAAYVGQSADILKDVANKPVGTTIWNVGSSKGSGSLQYRMLNPVTKKVEPKKTFFRKVGEDVCAVGAYEPQ